MREVITGCVWVRERGGNLAITETLNVILRQRRRMVVELLTKFE